ncbi:ATP-binding protein [Pseudomonas chlororaphis]|uniref:ATP-binding protein n=1 Tax=Pseudomonas chlororaphis TaxID=587753 RepID=UPI002367293B|nr:ATP-binding protein [Pseudomonas chlororaphis]WDH21362.1 ATP-binding protein [Pseudomonas chlororaphis]
MKNLFFCPLTMQRRLRGMAQAYERQQSPPPSQQRKSFDVRLAELLDAETSERESRKIERYLKSAKLRFTQATLEDVDYKSDRGLDRSRIMALSDCEW